MNRVITTFTDFDNRKWRDRLHGGKADDKTPDNFDPDDVAIGTAVEREHSSNPDEATEIAIDHIIENPEYYDQLIASGIADEEDAINLYDELKDDTDKEKAIEDILDNMDMNDDENEEGEEIDILEEEEEDGDEDDEEDDELGTDKADIENDENNELIIDDNEKVQEKIVKNYQSFLLMKN